MNKSISFLLMLLALAAVNINAEECNSDFGRKLEKYFVAKDLESIYGLYNMRGADDFIKKSIESSFKRNFNRTIEAVKIENIKLDQIFAFERNGVKYEINTTPVKELVLVFRKSDVQSESNGSTAMSVFLGVENGVCKIVTAAIKNSK